MRLEHARNRLQWQKRFAARTTDPNLRRIAERMVVTLGEVVISLTDAHELLVERSTRHRKDKDSRTK